jgi:hypothetical protein
VSLRVLCVFRLFACTHARRARVLAAVTAEHLRQPKSVLSLLVSSRLTGTLFSERFFYPLQSLTGSPCLASRRHRRLRIDIFSTVIVAVA